MGKIKKLLSAVLAALTLTACAGNAAPAETAPPELTVISHGNVVEEMSEEEQLANVSKTELQIPDHMETRYFSLSYDSRMQNAYDDVVNTISSFKDSALIPLTIPTRDYSRVLETVRCEQLAFFFLDSRTVGDYNNSAQTFEINFDYKYSIAEINTMLLKTKFEAEKIYSAVTDDMTDYEKVKYFHDYLAINVESSTDTEYVDSVYGALVEKRALCEGYAKAFSYLCNMAGIENMIVTGFTDIDHMWNMVKLGDKWYHVDIGWDQPAAPLRQKYPEMLLYQYFLVSDEVIENNSRSISTVMGDPPRAEDDSLNWYIYSNTYAQTYDEALDMIERLCRRCVDSGDRYFTLKVDSSNLFVTTASELVKKDGDGVSDIDRIVSRAGYNGTISFSDHYKNYRILVFLLD